MWCSVSRNHASFHLEIAQSLPAGAATIKYCFALSLEEIEANASMFQSFVTADNSVLQLIGIHIYAEGPIMEK